MKKYFANLLFIIIALLLICRGIEYFALNIYGVKTQGHITYTERAGFGRHSSNTYNVHYEFTLPDGSLQTGSANMSRRGGGEPSGWIYVKYLPFLTDFNKPSGSGIILYGLFWILPGFGLIIYNIIRMKKKKIKYERLARMSGDNKSNGILSSLVSFIVLLAIGSGLTWLLFVQPVLPKQANGPEIISDKYGNTQGNASNGGIAVRDRDSIYFANFADTQRLYSMKSDGSGILKLTEESVDSINFYDGWIYYSNFNDGGKLFKIRPDGTGRKRVYKWKSENVSISGGWFFLTNGNDHNRIYKVRLDGKKELQLNNDESDNLSIGGGWIYYTNDTDFKKLYRIRTDGSQRTAVTDFAVSSVIADETGAYFTSPDGGKLYRMDNGKDAQYRLLKSNMGIFNVIGDSIYFVDEDSYLSVMDLEGSGVEKLIQLDTWFISGLGDKLMTVDFMGTNHNYLYDTQSGELIDIQKNN